MNDKKLNSLIDKYTVQVERETKSIQECMGELNEIVKETDGLSIFANEVMGRLQSVIERKSLQVFLEKAFLNDLKQIKEKSRKKMDDIKIPSIEFVRLKKGITEEELNDYMAENDDGGFLVYLRYKYDFEKEWYYSIECASYDCCRDAVCWLNDWDEGQQNVEFLAISKLGEEYDC